MPERLTRHWPSAAEQLSELVFDGAHDIERRVPFEIGRELYAADFRRTIHSLAVGFWRYSNPIYKDDPFEELLGAMKFLKDSDEIRIKYDGLDDRELYYFAEGLTADRECEPEDLERLQPLMEAALKEIVRD